MKELFEDVRIELISLEEDVITTSNCGGLSCPTETAEDDLDV